MGLVGLFLFIKKYTLKLDQGYASLRQHLRRVCPAVEVQTPRVRLCCLVKILRFILLLGLEYWAQSERYILQGE